MPINFAEIIGLDYQPALAWLGRLDWMEFDRDSAPGKTYFNIMASRLAAAPGWDEHGFRLRTLFDWINRTPSPSMTYYQLDAIAAALATGPKVFTPTAEQFEAMEHVELHFPITEYRQAYPVLFVEIPPECRRTLAAECNVAMSRCPRYFIVRHRQDDNVVWSACTFGSNESNQGIFIGYDPTHPENTIEDSMSIRNGHEGATDASDWEFAERGARAALNLAMLLTHYGSRVTGPVDPVAYQKHRRKPALARFAVGDFERVELTRQIIVRDSIRHCGPHQGGGGWELGPKWRRGHWRRKPGLPLNAEKTVFIRPYQIRLDLGAIAAPADYEVKS